MQRFFFQWCLFLHHSNNRLQPRSKQCCCIRSDPSFNPLLQGTLTRGSSSPFKYPFSKHKSNSNTIESYTERKKHHILTVSTLSVGTSCFSSLSCSFCLSARMVVRRMQEGEQPFGQLRVTAVSDEEMSVVWHLPQTHICG